MRLSAHLPHLEMVVNVAEKLGEGIGICLLGQAVGGDIDPVIVSGLLDWRGAVDASNLTQGAKHAWHAGEVQRPVKGW